MKVRLKVAGGDVIEESAVEYFQGAGSMLEGLESEVDGLEAGDKKEGVIPAAKAFGGEAHQHEKSIPLAEFPDSDKLKAGAEFMAKSETGQDVVLRVVEKSKDAVLVKMLHPLASKDIAFEVEILSVTDPAPPPLPSDAVAADEDE